MKINIINNAYNSINDKDAKAKAKKRKEELINNVLENELEESQIFKSITKRLDICKITMEEMNENAP
jgi:nitroimidazol reductase NimA-like FMN-containing flavoprotein (pyridoxamine 5'-phosphate oxidase superfamily)